MFQGRFALGTAAMAITLLAVGGCTSSNDWGGVQNPFKKPAPFVATAVPADFALVVDETHNTFQTRQAIQQVLTAADGISRTTYTTYRDYNNSVADAFSREAKLTPEQLQAMWNEVAKNNLLGGSTIWVNWRANSDLYKKNAYRLQIRANGRTRTYETTNGFAGNLRGLMLLVTAVQLPISQEPGTPVVGQPAALPEMPAEPVPGTQPTTSTAPATAQ